MDLAALQTGLLHLVKDTGQAGASGDPYLGQIQGCRQLRLVRDIAGWWRGLGIEKTCALTSALLKRRRVFEETVRRFAIRPDISPFYRRQADVFLAMMCRSGDPLVAAVACFEHALIAIKVDGEPGPFAIEWHHEPYAVLGALLLDGPLDEAAVLGRYRTVVGPDIPGLFRVEPVRP